MKIKSIPLFIPILFIAACNDEILQVSSSIEFEEISFENPTNNETLYLLQSNKYIMLYNLIRKEGDQFKLDLTENDRIYLDIDEDSYNNAIQIVETLNNNH